MRQKYKLIACEVLRKETENILRGLNAAIGIDCEWLGMNLHENPAYLREELESRIAACEGKGYQAILLLFGLCSRATEGLIPPPDACLVVPRVHDCIALHLGSARRHRREHVADPGTLWLSRGFLRPGESMPIAFGALGAGVKTVREDGSRKDREEIRRELVREHGTEGADYLLRELGEAWKTNYSRVVYLDCRDTSSGVDRDRARRFASENGWRFEELGMDLRLIRMLLHGEWPENEFAVVTPGDRLMAAIEDDGLKVFEIERMRGAL